jgi:hypothetical protein
MLPRPDHTLSLLEFNPVLQEKIPPELRNTWYLENNFKDVLSKTHVRNTYCSDDKLSCNYTDCAGITDAVHEATKI